MNFICKPKISSKSFPELGKELQDISQKALDTEAIITSIEQTKHKTKLEKQSPVVGWVFNTGHLLLIYLTLYYLVDSRKALTQLYKS